MNQNHGVPPGDDRPRHHGRARLLEAASYVGLATYFVWPILSTGAALGIDDWDALLFQHASVLKALLEFRQPPFWNPWYCGGNVLWQNPQTPLLSPVYLFALAMSVSRAMKVTIALHYLAGLAGMHVLLRRGLGVASSAWVIGLAAMFTFAGGAALHLAVGHATFLAYFYLPWLLWLFVAAVARQSVRHAVGAAGVLAVCVWNGGVYVAVMGAVAVAVFAIAAALLRRDWRPAATLGFVGVLAALLCAPKLVPVLTFSADAHKVDVRFFPPGPDLLSLPMFMTSLFEPYQYRRLGMGGLRYGWHEYGNYFGPFGVFLIVAAIISVFADRRRRDWWIGASLALATVFVLLAAIGDFGVLSPYSLLRRLPGLSDLRISSRYLLVFTLMGAATVGWIVARDESSPPASSAVGRFVGVALLTSTLFVAYRNRDLLLGVFPYPPIERSVWSGARSPAPTLDPNTNGFGPDSPVLHALADNRDVMQCNEPLQLKGDVAPSKPMVFSDGPATVTNIDFSPNRIDFGVSSLAPARVYLNQRYLTGWRSSAGSLRIEPTTGLAYVDVPAGVAARHSFTFVPRGLMWGVAAWLVGLALAVVGWRRGGRRA